MFCFEPISTMGLVRNQVVGGRNGYGAKLANVFSTEFTVQTCDGKNRRRSFWGSDIFGHRSTLEKSKWKNDENSSPFWDFKGPGRILLISWITGAVFQAPGMTSYRNFGPLKMVKSVYLNICQNVAFFQSHQVHTGLPEQHAGGRSHRFGSPASVVRQAIRWKASPKLWPARTEIGRNYCSPLFQKSALVVLGEILHVHHLQTGPGQVWYDQVGWWHRLAVVQARVWRGRVDIGHLVRRVFLRAAQIKGIWCASFDLWKITSTQHKSWFWSF